MLVAVAAARTTGAGEAAVVDGFRVAFAADAALAALAALLVVGSGAWRLRRAHS